MTSLLSERALLVRPTISVWRGEMTDRNAGENTAAQHGADRKTLRVSKFLVPKEAIDPILHAAGGLRSFIRQETLPWRWDGVSLCPSENYLFLMEGWRARHTQFTDAVRMLIRKWDVHCRVGQVRLGSLAREIDYPTAAEVQSSFAADIEVFPVPDASDFRCDIGEAEAEEIRLALQASSDRELLQAQSYLWEQMQSCVGHIVERLSAYGKDADGKITGRFHDTLIGNLRDLTERLGRLNVTNDPDIEAMRQRLILSLCPHEPEELRQSESLRQSVRDEAQRIISDMSMIYGAAA